MGSDNVVCPACKKSLPDPPDDGQTSVICMNCGRRVNLAAESGPDAPIKPVLRPGQTASKLAVIRPAKEVPTPKMVGEEGSVSRKQNVAFSSAKILRPVISMDKPVANQDTIRISIPRSDDDNDESPNTDRLEVNNSGVGTASTVKIKPPGSPLRLSMDELQDSVNTEPESEEVPQIPVLSMPDSSKMTLRKMGSNAAAPAPEVEDEEPEYETPAPLGLRKMGTATPSPSPAPPPEPSAPPTSPAPPVLDLPPIQDIPPLPDESESTDNESTAGSVGEQVVKPKAKLSRQKPNLKLKKEAEVDHLEVNWYVNFGKKGFLARKERIEGPFTWKELQYLMINKTINEKTLIRREEETEFYLASDIEELFSKSNLNKRNAR